MKNVILLFVITFIFNTAFAQKNAQIEGTVSNNNSELLSGASILLYSKKDSTKIINFTIADEKGAFAINVKNKTNHFLQASYLGYTPKKVTLLNNSNYYKIILSESENNLEEIVIKASKYKDTVRLKKDTLKFSKNTKLKDILKDNEGIEITSENGIKFMGVPINKILVNKKEVFVNQNSLALENITNEMVDNIQVINNYKDKFNVDFDNFNEMVLNIDVKKKFRGVLKNILELGAGYKNAYLLKGKSFFFSDKVNVFLTQNTNSILNKSNNKNEIKNRHTSHSSFYNNNVSSIAQGFNEAKKDDYNNTYLLIKKETKKAKLATNIGFNYANQELENSTLISENQITLSTETKRNKRKGNLFYTDFNFTNLIADDFSINLFTNIDFIDNNLNWTNTKTVFPSTNFNSYTSYNTNNFLLKNTLNSKKIFHQKLLWENTIDYIYENTENYFSNEFNTTNLNQNLTYKHKKLNLTSSVFFQKNNLLNYGIKIDFSTKNENIASQINTEKNLSRKLNLIKSALIFKGQNTKWNYFANLGSQLFLFDKPTATKSAFPISSSLNYKFSSKKSINISYENNYILENIENSLDSLFTDATTLIKSENILNNIQQKQQLILNYNITNISKSKHISFLISGSKDHKFSQNSLLNFDTTINTFEKNIFDNRQTLFLKHRYSKGFYFSKNDHKLQLGYTISSSFSDSEIIQNNLLQPLYTEQYNTGLHTALLPQKMFFTELALRTNFSKNNIDINNSSANEINTRKNTVFLSKSDGNHIYSLTFYNETYKTITNKLNRNDINASYRYFINKNTSVFCKGTNIFNLLNSTKNQANITTNTINGLNITTINNNTFGYLIAGIQFKI